MYKQTSVYEFFLEENSVSVICRIELFESLSDSSLRRARAWIQKFYNMYPAFINTDANGDDLRRTHSSDLLLQEITNMLPIDKSLIIGARVDEKSLITTIQDAVLIYMRGL
jgi:hypothetical protein